MKPLDRALTVCSLVLVASCASTPMHFHTLVPAPTDSPSVAPVASEVVEIEPVRVPAQVDRAELVVRRNDGGLNLLEGEMWIAPLADEVRSAVLVELIRQLQAHEEAAGGTRPTISVRLDVDRFESVPARFALIQAEWRVRVVSPVHEAVVTCRSEVSQSAAGDYASLVAAHQRALIEIADEIAATSRRLASEGAATCSKPG